MLNRVYIIVGLIAILALAGAFIVPRFIQWGDYRDRMELLAEGVFGTDVNIQGDIDFALLPTPRLIFSDVVIGPADHPAATIESVDAQFALVDFLRDRYNLSALVLKSPAFAFDLDENGLFVSGLDLSGAGDGVALEGARIQDGSISLSDRRNGQTHVLSNVTGELRMGGFAGPFQFQGSGTRNETSYSLRLNSGVVDDAGSARVSAFIANARDGISLSFDGLAEMGPAPKFDGTVVAKQSPVVADRAQNIRGDLVFESKINASSDRVVLNGYSLLPDENRAGMRLTGAASIQLGARQSFEAAISGGVFSLPPRDASEDTTGRPYEIIRLLGELPAPLLPPIPGKINIDLAEIGLRGSALRNLRVEASTDGMIWTVSRADMELPGNTKVGLSGALRNDGGRIGFNGEVNIATQRLDALTQLWRKTAENTPLFNVPAEATGQIMLAGDALGFSHGRMTLNEKVHSLEVRLGFGDEPRLDLMARFGELTPNDSAILQAMFPDPGLDRTFAASFPEGSFSLNARRIRLLEQDATELVAEGNWSMSALRFTRLASRDLGGMGIDVKGTLGGTLAAPLLTGSGHVEIPAAGAPAVAALGDYLGAPLAWRQHIEKSLPASLDFSLVPDGADKAQLLTLAGTTGAARLDLSLQMAGGLTGVDQGYARLVASLEAESGEALVRQIAGGDTGLIAPDTPGFMSLFAEGDAESGFHARLSVSQEEELLAFSGEISVLSEGELAGTGTVDVHLEDGSGLAELVGAAGIGIGGIEASAGMDFYGTRSVALTGIVGDASGAALSGDLAVEKTGQRLNVEGELFVDRISMAGLGGVVFSRAALVEGAGPWPEGPLAAVDLARNSRGTVTVHAGEIDLASTALTNADFDVAWDSQSSSLSNLTGEIGGGTLKATLSKCCSGPLSERTVTGRISIDSVNLDAIAPTSMVDTLGGRVSGGVSFEGTGASIADVVSTLAGEGNFSLAQFSIARLNPGLYPAMSALDDVLNTDADALGILADQSLGRGSFDTAQASGTFSIAGGTLRLTNFIMEGEGARLAGGLDLNLRNLGLGGNFVLTPFNYRDASGLVDNDAARVVVRMAGTLPEPQVITDISEMIASLQVRANELEVDRLEALRLENEARQRAAAEERNRLIEAQRQKAAEEAAARAAAEEAARLAAEPPVVLEPEAPVAPVPATPAAPQAPPSPLNLWFQPGVSTAPGPFGPLR